MVQIIHMETNQFLFEILVTIEPKMRLIHSYIKIDMSVYHAIKKILYI